MKKTINFESALKRLEEIVDEMENGGAELEKSLEMFEEGTKLAKYCSDKLDEAKKALHAALDLQPDSAQAWYNLGLAQHAGNESEQALASFQQAVKLDPRDADSAYFEGVCYQDLKQFDKTIEILRKALEVNPMHASAEFTLARALQRTGNTVEAKEHFKQFQHLTNTKIGAPIGLSYGSRGTTPPSCRLRNTKRASAQ